MRLQYITTLVDFLRFYRKDWQILRKNQKLILIASAKHVTNKKNNWWLRESNNDWLSSRLTDGLVCIFHFDVAGDGPILEILVTTNCETLKMRIKCYKSGKTFNLLSNSKEIATIVSSSSLCSSNIINIINLLKSILCSLSSHSSSSGGANGGQHIL
jgi:hypothetical protein